MLSAERGCGLHHQPESRHVERLRDEVVRAPRADRVAEAQVDVAGYTLDCKAGVGRMEAVQNKSPGMPGRAISRRTTSGSNRGTAVGRCSVCFASAIWAMVYCSRPRVIASGSRAMLCLVGLVTALALWCAAPAGGDAPRPAPTLGRFEPSPIEVVVRMLQLAAVTRDDLVYDLGSGDGRIVIHAAQRYGARGVGVEIDPQLVWFARRDATRNQVDHLVTFVNADALAMDVSAATVVTLFLTREANLLLRPKLLSQLRRGARVVSHWHDMGDWTPDHAERITAANGVTRPVYLWRIGR
jgi:hypothetical protein